MEKATVTTASARQLKVNIGELEALLDLISVHPNRMLFQRVSEALIELNEEVELLKSQLLTVHPDVARHWVSLRK